MILFAVSGLLGSLLLAGFIAAGVANHRAAHKTHEKLATFKVDYSGELHTVVDTRDYRVDHILPGVTGVTCTGRTIRAFSDTDTAGNAYVHWTHDPSIQQPGTFYDKCIGTGSTFNYSTS